MSQIDDRGVASDEAYFIPSVKTEGFDGGDLWLGHAVYLL